MSTQTKKLTEWTDEELISYAKSLHESVNNIDCFGVNDLRIFEALRQELSRRGYEFHEHTHLEIVKEDDDEGAV